MEKRHTRVSRKISNASRDRVWRGECSSNSIRNFRHAWVLFVGRDLSLLSDPIENREKTFSKPTRIRHVRLWYVCRDSIPDSRPLPPFSISSAVVGKLNKFFDKNFMNAWNPLFYIYNIGEKRRRGGERGGRKEVERLVWKYFLNEFIKIIYNVLKFFSIFFYYINLYFFWNICNFIFLEWKNFYHIYMLWWYLIISVILYIL